MNRAPEKVSHKGHSLIQLFTPSLLKTFRSGYNLKAFKNDFFGGLTASIVALPLALAFGVASGAGPIAGLYGAIAVGFFATLFGGTASQISGPTGPMTVVMGAVIASHANNLPEAFLIVMLGGVIQIIFGMLRLGRYIVYTPYSVISGFMTGIGVIILILQTLPFIGLPSSDAGIYGTLQALVEIDPSFANLKAFMLAGFCLTLIIFWPVKLQRIIPAPLVALLAGSVLGATIFEGVPVLGAVPSGLPSIITPSFFLADIMKILQPAFVLALLGTIDSLLTSLVADSITKTNHDSDKELVGQGIGNLIAGLFGALPGAGATMRTIVNVRAGGHSPVSGILHALILLTVALGAGPIVSMVPHSVLAAILIKVGWDIIDWGYLVRMRHAPREKFIVMLVTLGLTVFVDLITAVAVGIILASFVTARYQAAEQIKGLKQTSNAEELEQLSEEEKALLRQADGKILVTILHGSFSYASARDLARRAPPTLTGCRVVIYDFSLTGYLDTSAALAINELISLSQKNNLHVIISGLEGDALKTLEGLGVLTNIPFAQIIRERKQAIAAAKSFVEAERL